MEVSKDVWGEQIVTIEAKIMVILACFVENQDLYSIKPP